MPSNVLKSLELALMTFGPDVFIPKYLRSVDDVASHRSILRSCAYSDHGIRYLSDLIWERVSERKRKNLIYGLQAIKWLLKNRDEKSSRIAQPTVDCLFELYRFFVFDRLDDIRWSVSAILKDKILRPAQVQWLLDHKDGSEQVVNRLLRYPQFDPLIAQWACLSMDNPELHKRRAELLGRLIVDRLPAEAKSLLSEVILWGIYYSSAKIQIKQKLIAQCASVENADEAIKICLRLGFGGPLYTLRSQLKNGVK